jgi:hypothetical protein
MIRLASCHSRQKGESAHPRVKQTENAIPINASDFDLAADGVTSLIIALEGTTQASVVTERTLGGSTYVLS